MSALPPVADPTASLPPSASSPNNTLLTPHPIDSAGVAVPVIASTVPTPVPVAPAPEATAAAIVASEGVVSQVKGADSGPESGAAKSSAKSSSSKKKKSQASAATAAATSSQSGSQGAQGENTGRWTAEEHRLFLQGLELHGKGWKKIAGLIKSRTVVQIRTHAQKYFQKLAKAKQNGEEGEIMMDARGGANAVPSVTTTAAQSNKRRKLTSGTKRKAIQSVVASAQREAKRLSIVSEDGPVGITSVAPALAPYVLPVANPMENDSIGGGSVPSITTSHGTISGPALEDSLFRFLTPAPVLPHPNVNEVARQAGATSITVPSDKPNVTPSLGEVSPTGVADFSMYSSWADSKDTPSWYAKGEDVDALLDVADTLDWLADTGDFNETYEEAANAIEGGIPAPTIISHSVTASHSSCALNSASMNSLPRIDSSTEANVPPLPSLFDGATDTPSHLIEPQKKVDLLGSSPSVPNLDDHLQVFDTPIEEHDFVSTILDDNDEGSSVSLAALVN